MSNVPADLKYTKTHQWARRQPEGLVEVGITDHAQESLGEMQSVQMPRPGQHVAVGESLTVVESLKADSDVASPLAGEIVAGNDALNSAPELINQDPYGKGWIARLRPSDAAWEAQLLSAAEYERVLQTESS